MKYDFLFLYINVFDYLFVVYKEFDLLGIWKKSLLNRSIRECIEEGFRWVLFDVV